MLGTSPLGRPLLRAPGSAAPAVPLLHGAAGPAWRQPGCKRSQLRLLCAAAGYRGSAPQRAAPLPSAAPANVRPPQPAPCKVSGVALLMWSLLTPAVRIQTAELGVCLLSSAGLCWLIALQGVPRAPAARAPVEERFLARSLVVDKQVGAWPSQFDALFVGKRC